MKHLCLLAFTLFISAFSIAQPAEYEATMLNFQKNYNDNDGQAIFNMMAPTMKQSISLKQISSIVDTYFNNFGKMESFEFTLRKDAVEVFLCHFEHGKQNMLLVANSEEKITGLLFKPHEERTEGKIELNSTSLQLPFKGEWYTYWGGTDKRQNYHVTNRAQEGAFDFFVVDKHDKSYERSGTRNEDYYAFGKPIYAVCDAVVYDINTGVIDNRPSQMNPIEAMGNYVILKTSNEEYIFYAHFQHESIKVKKGDTVKQGQYLGNCGNSGNLSEAHLHLHIQDGPNVIADVEHAAFLNR